MAPQLSDVERIKAASRHLRGTLSESLANPVTGALADDDTQLSKFHGTYQQDDRDLRSERKRQRLEPAYSFMIRARLPGGICSTAQWLNVDGIARELANGSIRLTTRQSFQLHGVLKSNLKASIAGINSAMMDTLAACGDVNRNVMAPTIHELSRIHAEVQEHAKQLSEHLAPRTNAYHEIWLDGEKLAPEQEAGTDDSVEPIYGKTYLPRKFKIAFVVPPQNDTDIYAQDLGFIAIVKGGLLRGYNVTVGGGMGMSHGETATYPRLGDLLGFCPVDDLIAVAQAVVTTQRDFGDRSNRKHARLKYTIDAHGIAWFREQVVERSGVSLLAPQKFAFVGNGDAYGWQRDDTGRWHYTLFVQNGRVSDSGERRLMSGLAAIAAVHDGEFRLTPNQNIAISNIAESGRARIASLLEEFGIENTLTATPLRLHSMACVAFPTCGLAMAESERYLPGLLDKLDAAMAHAGLGEEAITIRMTGCPNGCARPYIAEIGLVGKGPGTYNLYLGGAFAGDRLGCLYRENIAEPEILEVLQALFGRYAAERLDSERFGAFLIRTSVVRAVNAGKEFHGEEKHDG
ncbi:MAG TPA: NADPH-dependent assimilatory sulfite reductase hemoprotein subunit [Woeseiaceae bacterium]|nr:NADPH-dependent assimilatory sulfite reductase hemoprotein subunit [Woeseiaceae bacterium]